MNTKRRIIGIKSPFDDKIELGLDPVTRLAVFKSKYCNYGGSYPNDYKVPNENEYIDPTFSLKNFLLDLEICFSFIGGCISPYSNVKDSSVLIIPEKCKFSERDIFNFVYHTPLEWNVKFIGREYKGYKFLTSCKTYGELFCQIGIPVLDKQGNTYYAMPDCHVWFEKIPLRKVLKMKFNECCACCGTPKDLDLDTDTKYVLIHKDR